MGLPTATAVGDEPGTPDPSDPRMGIVWIVLLSGYLLALATTASYALFRIWPGDPADATDAVTVFGLALDFRGAHADRRLLLIALLAGGLGAFVSSAFSMARFLGKGQLTKSWTLYYILRPPAGMILAVVVYFLLRGGLLQPSAGFDSVSPYGVAAVSGVIGMFVRQATDKLRDVAETMFSTSPPKESGEELGAESGGAPGVPAPPATPQAVAAVHHPDPGA